MGEIQSMEEIRRSPVELGSLSHHLQGFMHPRWFSPRISEPSNIGVVCFSAASYEKKQPAAEILFQLEAETQKKESLLLLVIRAVILVGGFKHFLFSSLLYLGKLSNLTNIFQVC